MFITFHCSRSLFALVRKWLSLVLADLQIVGRRDVVVLPTACFLSSWNKGGRNGVIRQRHNKNELLTQKFRNRAWIVTLFDSTMILLQRVIEVLICSMLYHITHCFAYPPWIRGMSVRCDLLGSMTHNSDSLSKKRLAASISRFSLNSESIKLPS